MGLAGWIIVSASALLAPLILLIICPIMHKKGRGYNSSGRAMASTEAQAFASRMFARMLFRLNFIMLLLTIAGIIIGFFNLDNYLLTTTILWILISLPIVIIIPVIIRVESLLRRYFDKNGKALR